MKLLTVIIAGVLINWSIKRREINLKYVQLAVGVLQSEPDESVRCLRLWAVETIDSYSEIPLNEEAKQELLKNQLPARWEDSAKWNDDSIWKD